MKKAAQALYTLVIAALLMMTAGLVQAAQVKGLYQASIPVADRSDAERKRAVADGFLQVLVRVSGDSAVAFQESVQTAAASAERYVVQYGYETRSESESPAGVYLNVQYDSNGINNLLRRNSLPLWSSNRPRILVWMAWEQGLDRELVNANSMPGPFQMLQQEGKRRGVTLRFADFDADDQALVSLGDIWGMFPEPVLAASQHYQTPVVLIAKVRETATAIQINGMLQLDGQPVWLEIARGDVASGLRQLVDQVVDKVGARYALVTNGGAGEQIVLDVRDVSGLNDYAALTRYLDSLLALTTYRILAVQGERLQFLVTPASDLDALTQTFRIDRKLVEVADEPQPAPAAAPVESLPEPTVSEAAPAETPADPDLAAPEPAPEPAAAPLVIRYRWRG